MTKSLSLSIRVVGLVCLIMSNHSLATGKKRGGDGGGSSSPTSHSSSSPERRFRSFDTAIGFGALGLPYQFGQFCGGAIGAVPPMMPVPPMGGPCLGGILCGGPALPPPTFAPPPVASLHPCVGLPNCGMPVMPPQCMAIGGICGPGYGIGGGLGFGGGLNIGAMSSDAQIVWGAAAGFASLATFVEPRAFPSRIQPLPVLGPYYLGPRTTEHTARPEQ